MCSLVQSYSHVPGPLYCTHGLRATRTSLPRAVRTRGTGQLAPGEGTTVRTPSTYQPRTRTAHRGTPRLLGEANREHRDLEREIERDTHTLVSVRRARLEQDRVDGIAAARAAKGTKGASPRVGGAGGGSPGRPAGSPVLAHPPSPARGDHCSPLARSPARSVKGSPRASVAAAVVAAAAGQTAHSPHGPAFGRRSAARQEADFGTDQLDSPRSGRSAEVENLRRRMLESRAVDQAET